MLVKMTCYLESQIRQESVLDRLDLEEVSERWDLQDGLSATRWNEEVADSVSEFPYACAIQYRQIRGRTLLPGSEWDRV